MENNEIMNEVEFEEIENEETTVAEGETGLSTGLAMLIGGGLALAGAAGIKKLKKVITNHKAKKAAEKAEAEVSKKESTEEATEDK